MKPRRRNPPFLSAAIMRRAFQARVLSLEPHGRRVRQVTVERIGGFLDRSYTLRYRVLVELQNGRRRILWLRGSNDWQDQTRRQAYEIMKFLQRHGFDQGPSQIPRPVTFFWRWRLLVYEEAKGQVLRDRLQTGTASLGQMSLAGLWLARLHYFSPRTIRLAYNQAGRTQYWNRAKALLKQRGGVRLAPLRTTINRMIQFENSLARGQNRVLVHHDFHPGNMLMGPATMCVVDFAESRLSHPLVDVATFLAQLELQAGPTVTAATINGWRRRFLQVYRQHAPPVRLHGPAADRIFRFIRARIALQRYLGNLLKYKPGSDLPIIPQLQW